MPKNGFDFMTVSGSFLRADDSFPSRPAREYASKRCLPRQPLVARHCHFNDRSVTVVSRISVNVVAQRCVTQGRAQDFSLGGGNEGPKAESGGGVLGDGAATPSPPAMGSGGALCPGVRGKPPTAQRYSAIFST